jgi:hypothetical protein
MAARFRFDSPRKDSEKWQRYNVVSLAWPSTKSNCRSLGVSQKTHSVNSKVLGRTYWFCGKTTRLQTRYENTNKHSLTSDKLTDSSRVFERLLSRERQKKTSKLVGGRSKVLVPRSCTVMGQVTLAT